MGPNWGARVKKSRIFYTDRFCEIQQKTKDFLNGYPDFLSASTARSTRAFGDAVEGILGEHFQEIVGEDCGVLGYVRTAVHGRHRLQR